MKKVLVTGITGQDGLFLTNILLDSKKPYEIVGITRDVKSKNQFFNNLNKINNNKGLKNSVRLIDIDLLNFEATRDFIQSYAPDFVYNLSGPSSVYDSFTDKSIYDSILKIFDNLTSSLIENNLFPKFFQASSSELFANSSEALNESSLLLPKSPYAKAKLKNHYKVTSLKENYSWSIYSGLMFNHESEFRKNDYLIMKIINNAIKINDDKNHKLTIGSSEYIRDWSYAGDTANAIYNITENGNYTNYVIGSGKGHKISEILEIVFSFFNLDWRNYILIDNSLLREGGPNKIISDPSLILQDLGWKTKTSFETIITKCIDSKISKS
jgi:GDPmannose 4,6-dehydratase